MTYRAKPVTQRDGSRLQYSNCLMAAAAVGLDYHTFGEKTSTGQKMRAYSGDQSGGTNTDEIERAWHTGYDEDPVTRDGNPWDKVLDDLKAGRLVMLQVWHATTGGPCLSGSGQYGHGICLAPESRTEAGKKQWLVADPWCKPARWVWWDEARLKAGALRWADKVSASGPGIPIRDIAPELLAGLVAALMTLYNPDHPAEEDPEPPSVGGGGVLFASTAAHKEEEGGTDVSINTNGSHITSTRRVKMTAEAGFYAEAELKTKYGTLSKDSVRTFMGPAMGSGLNAHALLVNTSKPYSDGQQRPTIVYVTRDKCGEPYQVPDEANAERDKQWRAWLNGDADAPDKET